MVTPNLLVSDFLLALIDATRAASAQWTTHYVSATESGWRVTRLIPADELFFSVDKDGKIGMGCDCCGAYVGPPNEHVVTPEMREVIRKEREREEEEEEEEKREEEQP